MYLLCCPATGAFTFALQAPMTRTDRYLGLIRGAVKSAADTLAGLSAGAKESPGNSRQRGQLSHEPLVRLDLRAGLNGVLQTYRQHLPSLLTLFQEPPATPACKQPPGERVEE